MQGTRRGFTLLELLVSLGIVALLISFVAVAVTGLAGAGGQAGSLNALRNIQTGYNSYTVEAKSAAHFREDIEIFDFALSREEMAALEELNVMPGYEGSVTSPDA